MLLVLLAPSPLPFQSLQAGTSRTTMVDAAAVPLAVGRLLNKDHELVYAAQAKEAARTKLKDHKPVSLSSNWGLSPGEERAKSQAAAGRPAARWRPDGRSTSRLAACACGAGACPAAAVGLLDDGRLRLSMLMLFSLS